MNTFRRQLRIQTTQFYRQPDLTVVLENVFDPHNVSAVLRTADAVGIHHVHIIIPPERRADYRLGKKSSASAIQWLNIHFHPDIPTCYANLRDQGLHILTTHLAHPAQSVYDINWTQPIAIVFGNEHNGISPEAFHRADGNVIIPQVGMIQSLNISVAAAIILYEAFRQRMNVGRYFQRICPSEFDSQL